LASATSHADPLSNLSINDVTITDETSNATFTVSLDLPSDVDVTVDYATGNDSATAGEDYSGTSGQLTIPALQTSAQVSVPVLDDTLDENDESFFLNLSNPSNAALADAQGLGRSSTTMRCPRCRSAMSPFPPRATPARPTRPSR
jgi:hypothetical protein